MAAVLAAGLVGPQIVWSSFTPLLVLLGGAMLLLVVGALTPRWPKRLYALYTAAVAVGVFASGIALWHRVDVDGPSTMVLFKDGSSVAGSLTLDVPTVWLVFTIAVALFLFALINDDYMRREGLEGPEVYALAMLAAIGGIVMGAANDLIVLFLGLEILSISLYVLAASHRKRMASQEAGLKYFVLGGFSSAIFLYGVALLYGATGSTNFTSIVKAFDNVIVLDSAKNTMILAGVALLIVGLAFKVSAVPFHFWAPDVYQGAPTPVTGYMASAAKAAAFVAMLRVLLEALGQWVDDYRPVVWVLAVLTLVIGSSMAVVQTDVKRMLAFSSISHAGFMLVGVVAATYEPGSPMSGPGVNSVLFYIMVYSVLTLGTFGVVTAVSRTGDAATDLSSFRGLSKARPALAIALTVLLAAQAGVPLTSGFDAKFGVIGAAVEEKSYALAVIAMIAAVIAAILYLRILISVWVSGEEAGDESREKVRVPAMLGVALTLSVIFTIVIGIDPDPLLDLLPK